MSRTVLIVAAHPDDEALGCGGMISRHVAEGDRVTGLLLADGETSRGGAGQSKIEARGHAAHAAGRVLGATQVRLDTMPDNRLDTVPLIEVAKRVEAVVTELQPSIVYTHHGGDLNIDHRIVHQAVMTACRPQPGHPVTSIRCFEVLSSTEWASEGIGVAFRPTLFCDISAFLDKKLEALRCYDEEMRPFPHSRSYEAVEALARYRGASCGRAAAEAFVIARELI